MSIVQSYDDQWVDALVTQGNIPISLDMSLQYPSFLGQHSGKSNALKADLRKHQTLVSLHGLTHPSGSINPGLQTCVWSNPDPTTGSIPYALKRHHRVQWNYPEISLRYS